MCQKFAITMYILNIRIFVSNIFSPATSMNMGGFGKELQVVWGEWTVRAVEDEKERKKGMEL